MLIELMSCEIYNVCFDIMMGEAFDFGCSLLYLRMINGFMFSIFLVLAQTVIFCFQLMIIHIVALGYQPPATIQCSRQCSANIYFV